MAEAWFERVWNQRSDDAIFELSSEKAVGYAESDVRYFSMHAFKEFRDNLVGAMPDLRIEVEAIVEQPPDVVIRWFLTGTHTGNGFGFTPTHSRISLRGMTWLRVDENYKFCEGWDCWNQGRVMQTFIGGKRSSGRDEDSPEA